MIVLDTSFIIDYIRGVDETKDLIQGKYTVTTVISYHEIMTGVKMSKAKKEEKIFRKFFSEIKILYFDLKSADVSSEIASKLSAIGRSVNVMDILIAGIAIANGADAIVTADRDFLEIAKVSDLDVIIYR
ncbi:type II toxin-antitoxin system VapC family toxin [Archaeoglobus sp.]